ncbi:formyltransferase family protein [Psychrobacter aquaticus]|uniref:Methionyl-tRNA formyltransferase n=1 Tax=Psychrobacter aquaticus CMS 56 TaxID=1354303 RepID=U4T7M7_9GAMM|nr:formyltransferase family protein [Psychrobacter aquaticus]ERL56121.1 Methionyl-tRNA formyltransferase [Psychrobacter aquaticus CMS 56]
MIKVMIVGQKWLAEQLLKLCASMEGIDVVMVSAPHIDDRTAVLANNLLIPVMTHGKTLLAEDVPNGIDIMLMAHAHCFINDDARAKVKHGAVGYHPSLLPAYKGKTAIADAFVAGETLTGGSLYQLDDGWDTGLVIDQASVTISSDDTIKSLWQGKLAPLGLELFERYLKEMK